MASACRDRDCAERAQFEGFCAYHAALGFDVVLLSGVQPSGWRAADAGPAVPEFALPDLFADFGDDAPAPAFTDPPAPAFTDPPAPLSLSPHSHAVLNIATYSPAAEEAPAPEEGAAAPSNPRACSRAGCPLIAHFVHEETHKRYCQRHGVVLGALPTRDKRCGHARCPTTASYVDDDNRLWCREHGRPRFARLRYPHRLNSPRPKRHGVRSRRVQ